MLFSQVGIEDNPRKIEGTGVGVGADRVRAESVVAPAGELPQGERGCSAAGDIDEPGGGRIGCSAKLVIDQLSEVTGVQDIPDLVAQPVESDVF